MEDTIHEIVDQFPPMAFAFAYGSAVFQQKGYDALEKPMVDLVFAVDDVKEWHEGNLERHSHHYSSLKHLGPRAIEWVQVGRGEKKTWSSVLRQ